MGPKLATVSLALLTLFAGSFQSQFPSPAPECPEYHNGMIAASSCGQEYFICVDGVRQDAMYCPEDLFFNQKAQECQESCEDEEDEVITAAPVVDSGNDDGEVYDEGSGETEGYDEPQPTTEEPETVDFDCNGLESGNYADGCSDVFYTCVNGVAFKRYCPQGTVYNPSQQACDYDCTEAVTTTTQGYQPTTDSDVPSTTEATTVYPVETTTPEDAWETTTRGFDDVVTTTTTTQAPVICQEGQVTSFGMCSSRFNRCQNNAVRSKQCPVNTLFESSLVLCVFDLPQCQPVTVPAVPTYNNNNGNGYVSYGSSDTIVSPFDENVRLKPKFDRRRKYYRGPIRRSGYGNSPSYGNTVLENPFFIPRHHSGRHHGGNYRRGHVRPSYGPVLDSPFSTRFRGRAALNDQFNDYRRARMGKIEYGEARKVVGNKRFLMDDGFDGPKARYVQSDIQRIFPEARHSKKRLGPVEDPDGYKDEKTFDAKDLFGATRRKRSAYGYQQSGYGQQYTQISARQAQVNKDCQQYTTPTFLTFGDCFDQFIYCSGNGVNRMAACPIGETFNKALRTCSETCGVVAPVATSTAATQTADDSTWSSIDNGNDVTFATPAPSSYETYTTTGGASDDQSYTAATQAPWNDEPTTTVAPIGDRCTSVSEGLFSLGCSRKYIQCSHGAAIVRTCGSPLYFDQAKQTCNYKDQVAECGAQAPTTYSPIVTVPADDETTDSYGTPSDDTQATTTASQDGYRVDYGTTDSYGTPNDDTQTTTTSAPVGDQCSFVSSGLFSLGCSQKYIQCSDGAAIVRTCQSSLYFDQAKQSCDFKDQVAECGAQASTTYSPIVTVPADDGATDSYGTPSDDTPTTTTPAQDGYRAEYGTADSYGTPSDDNAVSTTSAPVDNRCSSVSGLISLGCSQKYIQCSNGSAIVRTCGRSLYFDQARQACDFRDRVAECRDQAPEPYSPVVTYPADDETTRSYGTPSDDTQATTTASQNGYRVDYGTTDSYGTPSDDTPATTTAAQDGYRSADVEAIDSYRTEADGASTYPVEDFSTVVPTQDQTTTKPIATTAPPSVLDDRCAHIEGVDTSGLGPCNSVYLRCSYGAAKLQRCPRNQVFSNAELKCVSRDSAPECTVPHSPPVKSYYNNKDQSAFCDGKSDGLYGNPKECSAILQCFGGELFEHPSCPSNLAFNEKTDKCDYPQKVRGCENHGRTDGECTEHGSFIRDDDDCSVFYRCVWGRKVVMKCPSGTLFNPLLSVCDWPSAVPSCGSSMDDETGY